METFKEEFQISGYSLVKQWSQNFLKMEVVVLSHFHCQLCVFSKEMRLSILMGNNILKLDTVSSCILSFFVYMNALEIL